MLITYAPITTQQCPECHHTSVYFFDDIIMCMLCGWERNRNAGPGPCAPAGAGVLELPVSRVRPPGKRARQRARKAAVAKKPAQRKKPTG